MLKFLMLVFLSTLILSTEVFALSGSYTGTCTGSDRKLRVLSIKVKYQTSSQTYRLSGRIYIKHKNGKTGFYSVLGEVKPTYLSDGLLGTISGITAQIPQGSIRGNILRKGQIFLIRVSEGSSLGQGASCLFRAKCVKSCKPRPPLCNDENTKKLCIDPVPTSTPTPTPIPIPTATSIPTLTTQNWAGSWICQGPGDATLVISGSGSGTSMRADFATASYGPAHDEYTFSSVGLTNASGSYTYYNSAPPGIWPGTFSLTLSNQSIYLERQDSSSSWHGSYVCIR